ncbi:unnamed protein product [Ectocarpus sp. 8 AP-2014]
MCNSTRLKGFVGELFVSSRYPVAHEAQHPRRPYRKHENEHRPPRRRHLYGGDNTPILLLYTAGATRPPPTQVGTKFVNFRRAFRVERMVPTVPYFWWVLGLVQSSRYSFRLPDRSLLSLDR